ncbi:hypothetical protein [Niveispirillum sp. KHB5.9]|uniref:hypothetical protein n=1 Tax=Niveispirillum sp. KHB5.9 TaxID=3400269 RepID=UPI003A838046
MKDGKLRLKACINIEFQTENFVEAGEHQKQLMVLLDEVRRLYPESTLDMRELRNRGVAPGMGGSTPRPPVTRTGRLRPYASVA